MNALTYEIRGGAAAVRTATPARPAKGLWARFWDALIESRMRAAEREIRMHAHLLPKDVLARNGFAATYKDAHKLPFVK